MIANENRFTSDLDLPGSTRRTDAQSNDVPAAILVALVSLVLVALASLAALVNVTQALGVNEEFQTQSKAQVEYLPSAYAKEQAQAPAVREHIQAV